MTTQSAAAARVQSLLDNNTRPVKAILPLTDEPPRKQFKLLSMSELGALPPQRWLVKRVIPAESVGIIYGGSGGFKTFVALDLALHVAHGLSWLGRKTESGDVVLVVGEGAGGIKKRCDAWHAARGLDPGKARLFVLPVAVDLLADADGVAEAVTIRGLAPALVIVDTLSQTFRGEENSANEVAAYLSTLGEAFRDRWRAAVIVIHHTGHTATERPRGSSTLRSNVDFLFGVFRDKAEMLTTVTNEKQKDEEEAEDISFQLRSVPLGTDADGDPISSLAAFHVRTAAELREIVAEQVEHGRKGYHARLVELAQDGQKEADLRGAFYETCSDLGSTDSKSKAFRRALKWATNSGLLGIVNGRVLIVGRLT